MMWGGHTWVWVLTCCRPDHSVLWGTQQPAHTNTQAQCIAATTGAHSTLHLHFDQQLSVSLCHTMPPCLSPSLPISSLLPLSAQDGTLCTVRSGAQFAMVGAGMGGHHVAPVSPTPPTTVPAAGRHTPTCTAPSCCATLRQTSLVSGQQPHTP